MGCNGRREDKELGEQTVNADFSFFLLHHILTEPSLVRKRYRQLKDEWCGKPEVFDRPDIIEARSRAAFETDHVLMIRVAGASPHRC
jgi:hypothetical protein